MKMKMKLLDYTLIGLLAGMAPLAMAQESVQSASGDAGGTAQAEPAVDCTDSGCTSQEGLLFRLRTRGERKPVVEALSLIHI